ncbi:MAG: ABC transporter substrate-binding protein [Deltaproteobacteria bacterium]|nr:ABC transporter substrate-binding protein [Deltaproteobacteria bacterium]
MSRWSRRRFALAVVASLSMACGDRSAPAAAPGPRVVSQTVLSDEVLWALGPAVRTQVVAVSTMADDVRYSGVAGQWPTTLPRAAGTGEALLALSPSMVILASFTAAETRALITKAGLPTLLLEHFDGFDDYRANVTAIAEAVDATAAGRQLVQEFDDRLAALRIDDSQGPRVVSWNEGSVPGEGTSFDDIARAAGFRNLPADQGRKGHLQIGLEQLVAWDPDVIVVPCGTASCDEVAREVAARPGLRGTRAARESNVIAVPSRSLYSTGAGMLDVVELLAASRKAAP